MSLLFGFKKFFELSSKQSNMIYCDMDGVLVDFDLGIKKTFPTFIRKPGGGDITPEMWQEIEQMPNWWLNLKPLPGYELLWNYIKSPKTCILTAVPYTDNKKVNADRVSREKVLWCMKYLRIPESKIIVTTRENKQIFAKSPIPDEKNILIDDMEKNIKEWENSGGIGILHKTVDATLRRLKTLGK